MAITERELFHGVVLAKLLRKVPDEAQKRLRLYEFFDDKSSSAYQIDAKEFLYIKHSKSPKPMTSKGYDLEWNFSYSLEHLQEIKELHLEAHVYTALVCGKQDIGEIKQMEICFLSPERLRDFINLDSDKPQWIKVASMKKKGCSLRVWGTRNGAQDTQTIPQNEFDKWRLS